MGGEGSGDRTQLEKVKDTIAILRGAAPDAASYLRDIITGKVKRPSWIKFKVCEFIIEHEIGKPPQRHELSGAGGTPLTWQAVILLAEQAGEGGELPKIVGGVQLLAQEATKPKEEPEVKEA